jgi:hypothetical protein
MSDPFDFTGRWGQTEDALWSNTFGREFNDPTAKALYHEGLFAMDSGWSPDQRTAIRDNLRDYLYDTYGIDFDAEFDWDAWRESYADAIG